MSRGRRACDRHHHGLLSSDCAETEDSGFRFAASALRRADRSWQSPLRLAGHSIGKRFFSPLRERAIRSPFRFGKSNSRKFSTPAAYL